MRIISAQQVHQALTPREAVHVLRETLTHFDPADDGTRQSEHLAGGGDLLMMPASFEHVAGIKILTMNPRANELNVPMIQGQFMLFDGRTLTPQALLDGEAITSLRTPAVSLSGVLQYLNESSEPLRVVIFGTGPQGRHHLETIESCLGDQREIRATFLSRNQPDDLPNWCPVGSAQARQALAEAELIICATSAQTPILELEHVRNDAVIVALGSHTPTARELGGELMGAAQVILEEPATAARECGDMVLAVDEGHLSFDDAVTFKDVVTGEKVLHRNAPIVFKFSGMGWEDLAIADAIYQKIAGGSALRAQ